MQGPWPSAQEIRSGNLRTRFLPAALLIAPMVAIFSIAASAQSQPAPNAGQAHLNEILAYIHTAWDSLTRSTSSCGAMADSKLSSAPVLYLPADFEEPRELDKMQHNCKVKIEHLPQVIHQLGTADAKTIRPPGLLYLSNPYVVPGGRFNEMY